MQLVVDKLGKAFGIHEIFHDVSFMIAKGEKIGLVGVNGSGKSTLVKCLLEPEYADTGTVAFETGLQVGYVEQGFGAIGHETLWEFMLEANREIPALRQKLAELEQAAASGEPTILESYARVTQRYEYLDGYNYEARVKRVLLGLSFPESMWQQKADTLSGGQKTRLLLAGALVSSPEFMLLDEPTNHLDIRMMEWLEGYLREFKGGVLVVSHDRVFLDNVATRILEMEDGRLSSFPGNYTKYLAQKALQVKTEKAAYAAQQSYIAEQETYIRRFKAGIKSKMARGRQSRLDRLERLEAPAEQEVFSLRLPSAPESAERVLILERLKAGYGENVLVEETDLILRRGEKVGLIGPNGSGKTTLLRTILGEIPALGGEAKIGNRVRIGYFSQSYERLDPGQTLFDNLLTEYGLTDEAARSLLGGMLFHGEEVFRKIETLSGGQKARLVLLKLVLDGANLLILDEPTNHLDILAKETVEAALEVFDGTVLVVSHDRYLINEVTTRIWEIGERQIRDYRGNYAFYLEQNARSRAETAAAPGKGSPEEQGKQDLRDRKSSAYDGKDILGDAENGRNAAPPASWHSGAVLLPGGAVSTAADGRDSRKKGVRRHTPSQVAALIEEVEMKIRQQDAMLAYIDKQISMPENQQDLSRSRELAQERALYEEKSEALTEQWEMLLEEQEALEQDEELQP